MSRGSSPSRNSRRPWKSPWRPLRPCASRPATRARGGGGVAELRELREDDDLGRQLDEARLAEEREGELRRQAEARVGVAAAAREGVAIGGVLQAARRGASGSSTSCRAACSPTRSSTSTENEGSRFLPFDRPMPMRNGRRAWMRAGRLARDGERAQRHLAHDPRGDDERQHHAEQQVEQVVAGVDGGEADADGDADEVLALARERQAARRADPAPPATCRSARARR